jgi:hypothetical protein
MLCPAHDPGADGPAGEAELRSVVSVLLREIHAEAELCDFIRLPWRPDDELRVGCPGIDLAKTNGDDSWTLPMPARHVIDRDGVIRDAQVDPDYTRRPEPSETLAVLRALHD